MAAAAAHRSLSSFWFRARRRFGSRRGLSTSRAGFAYTRPALWARVNTARIAATQLSRLARPSLPTRRPLRPRCGLVGDGNMVIHRDPLQLEAADQLDGESPVRVVGPAASGLKTLGDDGDVLGDRRADRSCRDFPAGDLKQVIERQAMASTQ